MSRVPSLDRAIPMTGMIAMLALVACLGDAAEPAKKAGDRRGPPSPEQALKQIRLPPGLRLELVAAEPQIESPVAMAFDEDGRLWVVEMRDYPNGPDKGQPPAGRIKVLEDRDGDGRFEHSTIFADHLLFANGLMPWRGGVLVTAAPHIAMLRDTDGDGKADSRDVLYEGFAALNPQLRVSNPVLGGDNWVYVANGLRGGQVVRAGQAAARPLNLSGMDFRFELIHDRHEAISGMGQYGNTFDDWGRRFVCDNRHHLRHIVLENRYLKRNPSLAAPAVVEDPSELEDGPLSSGGKIHPLSKNWTTSSLHVGRFTAACGVFIYRGDLLPEEYRGCAFTCDPTGNLVHQEVLSQRGATFRSKPPRPGVEFLASPDDWFRPVFLSHGPDGALYLVDMCRAVIEHPEFMPVELKNRPDLTLGKDRGRIWRIVPDSFTLDAKPSPATTPRLSKATIPELVSLLAHANAWRRTTAQRLLLERQDRRAIEPLRQLVRSSRQPVARYHGAWLLEAYGALDSDLIQRLLEDESPRVREQGVRLAEMPLAGTPALQQRLIELAGDPDPRVRFQVALSLGEWDDARILPPLARIALAGADDRWTRLAVASAVPARAGALVATLLGPGQRLTNEWSPGRATLLQELLALVGARRDPAEVADTLAAVLQLDGANAISWQLAALNGLADGMGRRGTQLSVFLQSLPESRQSIVSRMTPLLAQAAVVAADPKQELPDRLAATRLLAHAFWSTAEPVLGHLVAADPVQEVRLAAVRALSAHPRPEVARLLLGLWKTCTPAVRREVTEALLRQPDRIGALLQEVEAGRVKPGDIDMLRTRQLVNHGRPEIRDRARKLLQENLPADRKLVLERYRPALALKGDPHHGKAIFQKNCAGCHRVAGVGVDVAPDIADSRTKTIDQLLLDILSPNQAIDNNYINYSVTTKNGKALTGIIAAETASSITLRRAENQTDVILRQDIDEITSTGVSLMPEGLEKGVSIEEMADLLSFLKNWRYLDGDIPFEQRPSGKQP